VGDRPHCTRVGREFRLAATAANVPVARHELDAVLDALECSGPLADAVRLAVTEACANAVVHAYPAELQGEMVVTLQAWAGVLVVTVRDYGVGISPDDPTAGLGVGLQLIHSLAATVSIADAHPGVSVHMEFLL
jgi:anti-sigma regulatory factor (Ser/Thr protein kinase)